MTDAIQDLSAALAAAVEKAGRSVVRVEARRRGPSSGTVWSADGLVVAAHHTLDRDEDVKVGLPEGGTAPARVIGRDPTTDVGLLRVEASGLAVPEWRPADDVKVGHLVLALTRPGRSVRARLGIVHALGDSWRSGAGGRIDRYVETDVGIQPAFSGSLLADGTGRALGMNSAGLLRGASLAVPHATLLRVIERLLAHGRVRRGFLGIGAVPVRLPDEAALGQTGGLLVASVQADSAAARGGLLLGDVLLAVDGQPLASPADLLPFLEEERIGGTVGVKLLRAGEVREARIAIGARDGDETPQGGGR